jgi:PIN domain nuclease of toxin-antitoxin system
VRLAAFTPEVAARASFLPGELHHDPAGRILVATAMEFGLRPVTRDRRLLAYGSAGYLSVLAS